MSKKQKAEGHTPHRAGKLDTLAGIRTEMARLYRLTLSGKMEADKFTKMIYGLREIRECIERGIVSGLQERIEKIAARVGAL